MKDTVNILSEESVNLLRQMRGKRLNSLFIDNAQPLERALSQMIICDVSGKTFGIWSEEQPNRRNEYPDLARLVVLSYDKKIAQGFHETLHKVEFGQLIESIEVVTDEVEIIPYVENPFKLINTRAIVIHLEQKCIVIEKMCHWSEFLEVSIYTKQSLRFFSEEWSTPTEENSEKYVVNTKFEKVDNVTIYKADN